MDWENDSLETILVKNYFIVSPDEFMDEKHWDDEGCELIGYNPWASSSDDEYEVTENESGTIFINNRIDELKDELNAEFGG